MIGCLCQLDFSYNRTHVGSLRQAHGWAYGVLLPNGNYHAFQAEVIGNEIVVADGVPAHQGVIYGEENQHVAIKAQFPFKGQVQASGLRAASRPTRPSPVRT
jgi:hypothetical protein